MLYEDVDFKTLSDSYTYSHMVPFLTHIDGSQSKFIFNKSSAKLTPTVVNQQLFFVLFFCFFLFCVFFFTVKLDAANSFPSNTAEVWPIYLKMGHIMRKPVRIHAVWSAPLLFAAWIVTRFYSSKLYSSIGTYTMSPTCQSAETPFLNMYICLSPGFTLQEQCYTDSFSLCRFFVINLLD